MQNCTIPLKYSEKHDFDNLMEIKIKHKAQKIVQKTLQPSKSYVRLKKEMETK